MGSLVIGLAVVAAFFVLGLLAIRTADRHLAGCREIDRLYKQTLIENQEASQAVARRDADIDSMTVEAAAEFKKAQLLRDAAELRAEARVIEKTTDDLVAERRRVIQARTEGAELAAKEQGLRGGEEYGDTTKLRLLVDAYKAYCAAGGDEDWDDWIGDRDY